MTGPWFDPYSGLPVAVQVFFYIALAVTLSSVVSVTVLRVQAWRATRRSVPAGREADFLWVFVVPALNEAVTIADSVSRLQRVEVTRRMILVIDDGSDDGTGEILRTIRDPDLTVLTRRMPEARRGKAAALNAAWRHLHAQLRRPEFAGIRTEDVIVCVVDADGRLSPTAPGHVAARFADARIGGVQSLVRIYNRHGWLTWAQDVEFGVFGGLFQQGRSMWGTANMGGNGQFNRLAALDSVAGPDGPWRHRLTEDQDVGVRLLQHGWLSAQENRAEVHQQGVNSLRLLYRQRTRWAQGAFEAISLMRGVRTVPASRVARLDMYYYLLTPVL